MTVTWRQAVPLLRLSLVALFGVLVVFEVMSLPGQWAHLAEEHPEHADLRWPLTAVSIFWVVCLQVVVVCIWKLLSLVRHDRIFSEDSLKWVDAIVGAIVAGWVVLVGVFLVVGFNADDPGLPLVLFFWVVCGAVLGLLVVVMRALLRQATTLRTDLESVI